MRGKFDARRFFFQRRAQHGRTLDDPDAVRQDQVGAVDGGPRRPVFPAGFHDLRIGCHHIVGALAVQQGHSLFHGFRHCHIVKANA